MSGTCCNCGKECKSYENYCNWDCHIELAKKGGGKVITPNNLPIKCIMADGTMLEIENGDHPDYKFPVDVLYTGPITDTEREDYAMMTGASIESVSEEQARDFYQEAHALIYSDGNVAITIYECCYAMFHLNDGFIAGGSLWKEKQYQLSDESREKIKKLTSVCLVST